jgi:1,6-anhydro-N-acetylmuramate kinase
MTSERYVGLMSGTSLDGVDAVVVVFAAAPGRLKRASENGGRSPRR